MSKKIAVLAGDGIGPEVMQETLRVLKHLEQKFCFQFEYINGSIGGHAFDIYGLHCPDETLALCHHADAILFGSVGGPIESQEEKWKNCEVNSILKIRKALKLGVNIRPINVYSSLQATCPIKVPKHNQIDFLIFRELTGGIYFGKHERAIVNEQRIALDECVYAEEQIRCVAHAAFQAARKRRKKVCSVDKANVLATSKLWREIISEVAASYHDVELSHMLVDNCAMQIMLQPFQFDVIVTENLFGDILSDLAATLPGSLGLIPSASLNQDGLGLYEPSGGSAPDIAGKNIANPSAQILSAAMMLRYSFGMDEAAACLENAIKSTLANDVLTLDVARSKHQAVSTTTFVDSVIAAI